MKYLLDSNICIHFLKNDYGISEKIAKVGLANCYISEITLLELLYGIENSNSTRKEENRERYKKFKDGFYGRILLINPTFEVFSIQKSILRKLGTPISDFDLLIGSTALVHGMTMVTRNVKELSRIDNLVVENWIDA